MIRTLVMAVLGAVMFVYPSVAQSQSAGPYFPREQVEAATKELDEFLQTARTNLRLPFEVPEREKYYLVLKYLDEADQSPFFWVNLEETFSEVKKKMPAAARPYSDAAAAEYVVRVSYENVMSSKWGSLALSSEPSGADVWLERSSGRTKEGQTRISRRYPEGPYTFVVELQGYKRKEVPVNIDRDKPVEEKVMLEKQ